MNIGRDESGKFIKGNKVNQGRVPSIDQKRKQSETMMGRILKPEHKANIGVGMLRAGMKGIVIGHPKGMPTWNKGMSKENGDLLIYGKPRTDETKRKMSESSIGRVKTEVHKKNLSLANIGKSPSMETRKKQGELMRLRWADPEYKKKAVKFCMGHIPWNKGKRDCFTQNAITQMLTRRTPNSLENKIQEIIDKNKLPYKFVGNGSFMIGRKNPDFININGAKIAVEVYAKYYKFKRSETIEKWKEERQRIFEEYGWKIIFFDETEVNEDNILQQLRR